MRGSLGLGGGGETGGDEAADLGMHGLGATAGFVLLRVAGEGWERETTEDWERRPGLGAMGGGEGLVVVVVVVGSLGLGANGGFFTPARKEEEGFTENHHLLTLPFENESCSISTTHRRMLHPPIHPSLNISTDSCKLWLCSSTRVKRSLLGSEGKNRGLRD